MIYKLIGNLVVTIGLSITVAAIFVVYSTLLLLGGVSIAIAGAFISGYIPKEERKEND